MLQLVDIFLTLLERPLIKEDFDKNYPRLITMMEEELAASKDIYDFNIKIYNEKGKMAIHKNMPKIAGGLKWKEELKQRIVVPMTRLKQIEHP